MRTFTPTELKLLTIRARELRLNAAHADAEMRAGEYGDAIASLLAAQIHLNYILKELQKDA